MDAAIPDFVLRWKVWLSCGVAVLTERRREKSKEEKKCKQQLRKELFWTIVTFSDRYRSWVSSDRR